MEKDQAADKHIAPLAVLLNSHTPQHLEPDGLSRL